MSDPQEPFGGTPPPPPTQPPTGAVLVGDETEVRGGIGTRVVAAVLGVVLVVGGVGFAATQLGGSDGSPEEAVRDLFVAISDEDVLGVLASFDPGERDALVEPVTSMFDELERLEVTSGLDPSAVQGLDLQVDGLELRVEPVRDDLARVVIVGGTITGSYDTDELPLGAFVTDTLDRFDVEYRGLRDTATDQIATDEDAFLAVRRGGDGWRVSLAYTAAEAARLDAGQPVPTAAEALAPIGSDDPEAAVRGIITAAFDLDLEGVVARLSPAEVGALHDYWPLVRAQGLPDPADLADEVDIELVDLALSTDDRGDTARVTVDRFTVGIATPEVTLEVTVADGCVDVTGDIDELGLDGVELPLCADDLDELLAEGLAGFGFGADEGLPSVGDLVVPELRVTTDRVDGRWYVAPVRSSLDVAVDGLRSIERADLDALVDAVEEILLGFEDAFSSPFDDGSGLDDTGVDDEAVFGDETDPFGYAQLPRPGASDEEPAPTVWSILAEQLAVELGDADRVVCAQDLLQGRATTAELYHLADLYLYDLPVPAEVTALREDIVLTCVSS